MSTPSYLENFLYGGMNFTVCHLASERDVSILFSVEFVVPPSEPIETIMARFQNDLGLKLSIALYYGIAVRHMNPMIHVDEVDDDAGVYLMVSGPRSLDLIDMVSSQIGTFNTMTSNLNIVETRNRIASYTHRNYNPDGGDPIARVKYSVSTKICSMQDRGPFPSMKASPFGAEVTVGYVSRDTLSDLNVASIVGDPNLIRIIIEECRTLDEWFFDTAFPELRVDTERDRHYGHTSTDFVFLGQAKEGDHGVCTVRIIKRLDTFMGWHIHYASWNRMIIAPADIYDDGKRMVTISPSTIMNIQRGISSNKMTHDEGIAGQMLQSIELLHANLFQSPQAFVYGHVTNWAIEKVDGMEYYDVSFRNLMIPWTMTELIPKIEGLEADGKYNPKAVIFTKPGMDLQMVFPIEPINPIVGAIAYGRFNASLGSIAELYGFCSSRDDVFVKIIAGYDQWIVFALIATRIDARQVIRPQVPVQAYDVTRGYRFRLFRTDYLMELHNDIYRSQRPSIMLRSLKDVFYLIVEMISLSDTSDYLLGTENMPPDEIALRLLSAYVRTVEITADPYLDAMFTSVVRERFSDYIQSVEGGQDEQAHNDDNDPGAEESDELQGQHVLHVDPHKAEATSEDPETAPPAQVSLSPDQIETEGIRPDVMRAVHNLATATLSTSPDFSDIQVIDYTDDAVSLTETRLPMEHPSPLFGRTKTAVTKYRGAFQQFWIDYVTTKANAVPNIESDTPHGSGTSYDEQWTEFQKRHSTFFCKKTARYAPVPMKVLRAIGFIAGYWPDGKWKIRDLTKWSHVCPSYRYRIRKSLKQAFYCDVRDGIVTDPNVRPSFIMYTHPNLFGSPDEPMRDLDGLSLTKPWIRFRITTDGLACIEATTKYAYFLRPEARKKFIQETIEHLVRNGFEKNQICCENALEP